LEEICPGAALLICRLNVDFGRQLATNLLYRLSRLVTAGERSFASAGPKLWNSLPDDIASASSLTVFRRKLKAQIHSFIYFGRHIRTLVCSLSVVVIALVALAVIYLDQLANCHVM